VERRATAFEEKTWRQARELAKQIEGNHMAL
jgi:hypothetical protein